VVDERHERCQRPKRNSRLGSANGLLFLVFAFAQALEDGESGFFGVGEGDRLELDGGIEGGNELAHRAAAGWADFQGRRTEWTAQREFAAADGATALAQFVFVDRHIGVPVKFPRFEIAAGTPPATRSAFPPSPA
jgi:hypothetical protein